MGTMVCWGCKQLFSEEEMAGHSCGMVVCSHCDRRITPAEARKSWGWDLGDGMTRTCPDCEDLFADSGLPGPDWPGWSAPVV